MSIVTDPQTLLGTPHNPPGFDMARLISRAARAYHALGPYPSYSAMTKNWKVEERGPYPRCLPFVQEIVTKGARWLFGKPVTFRIEGETEQSKALNDLWTANDMGRRSVAAAVTGALSGGVVLKWSYDESKDKFPKIHVLDPSETVRLYWDPFDASTLLMARVQFPFYNQADGLYYWYREDWTDDSFLPYEIQPCSTFGSAQDPYDMVEKVDTFTGWIQRPVEVNPAGIIPLWYIRNKEVGKSLGEGDLWTSYHVVDMLNFTWDLAFKHNQKFVDPDRALIDLQPQIDDEPSRGAPTKQAAYETKQDSEHPGRIELLETKGDMREHLRDDITEISRQLYTAAGSVDVNTDEITNKGNLTPAVLEQLYAPLIASTEEKRKCYGEDGVCVLLERMTLGLANAGAPGWAEAKDIQAVWPPYFDDPEDQRMALATRKKFEVESGYETHERAQRTILSSNGVIDAEEILPKLPKVPPVPAGEAGEGNQ